jgi:hypothetical protein
MSPTSDASSLIYGSHIRVPSAKGPSAVPRTPASPGTPPSGNLLCSYKAASQAGGPAGPQPFQMDSLPVRTPAYVSSRGRSKNATLPLRGSRTDDAVQHCLILQRALAAGLAAGRSSCSPTKSFIRTGGMSDRPVQPPVGSPTCREGKALGEGPADEVPADTARNVGRTPAASAAVEPTGAGIILCERKRGTTGVRVPRVHHIEEPPVMRGVEKPCGPYSMEYGVRLPSTPSNLTLFLSA